MLPSNVHKNSQGFTLIEILVILIIIGILSAIAAPSFLGMLNRNQVNNALSEVRGALQEAQREAIRKSKSCTVVLPAGSNLTLTSPPEDKVNGVLDAGEDLNSNGKLDAGEDKGNGVLDAGEDLNSNGKLDTNNCLVTGTRTFSSSVGLESNQPSIIFSHLGTITVADGATIVFFNKDNYSDKICLAISAPLGIIRTGTYKGQIPSNATNPIKWDKCEK